MRAISKRRKKATELKRKRFVWTLRTRRKEGLIVGGVGVAVVAMRRKKNIKKKVRLTTGNWINQRIVKPMRRNVPSSLTIT